MQHQLLYKLQWHFYRVSERLGYMGNFAILLLLILLLGYCLLILPLRQSITAAEAFTSVQPNNISSPFMTAEADLNAFEKALPSVGNRATAVQSFMDIAIAENLEPNEITYKTVSQVGDPFSHYHVQFALYASYPAIQHFLSELLHQLNYVSIESLTYERQTVKDQSVEARVHLVFHFNRLAPATTTAMIGEVQ